MTKIFVTILAKYKKTELRECRSLDGVYYELSFRWDRRYRFEVREWPAAKDMFKARLAIYARLRKRPVREVVEDGFGHR